MDAAGAPIVDAMIEIWQADAAGHYADGSSNTGFIGFGRSSTDESGVYRFRTIRPGRVDEAQAPHIAIGVFGRGLLKRLVTRTYFEGDTANADDPILALVPAGRRGYADRQAGRRRLALRHLLARRGPKPSSSTSDGL